MFTNWANELGHHPSIRLAEQNPGPGSTDEECCTRADLPVPWPWWGSGNSYGVERMGSHRMGDMGLVAEHVGKKVNITFKGFLRGVYPIFGPAHTWQGIQMLASMMSLSFYPMVYCFCYLQTCAAHTLFLVKKQGMHKRSGDILAISKWLPDKTEESFGDGSCYGTTLGRRDGSPLLYISHSHCRENLQDFHHFRSLNFPATPMTSHSSQAQDTHVKQATLGDGVENWEGNDGEKRAGFVQNDGGWSSLTHG